jgi:preprotein translocase subunit SecF
MMLGIVIGTYSSIYVSASMLITWVSIRRRRAPSGVKRSGPRTKDDGAQV